MTTLDTHIPVNPEAELPVLLEPPVDANPTVISGTEADDVATFEAAADHDAAEPNVQAQTVGEDDEETARNMRLADLPDDFDPWKAKVSEIQSLTGTNWKTAYDMGKAGLANRILEARAMYGKVEPVDAPEVAEPVVEEEIVEIPRLFSSLPGMLFLRDAQQNYQKVLEDKEARSFDEQRAEVIKLLTNEDKEDGEGLTFHADTPQVKEFIEFINEFDEDGFNHFLGPNVVFESPEAISNIEDAAKELEDNAELEPDDIDGLDEGEITPEFASERRALLGRLWNVTDGARELIRKWFTDKDQASDESKMANVREVFAKPLVRTIGVAAISLVARKLVEKPNGPIEDDTK